MRWLAVALAGMGVAWLLAGAGPGGASHRCEVFEGSKVCMSDPDPRPYKAWHTPGAYPVLLPSARR